MNIKKFGINEIKPYWRNPRKNDEAVDAVKKSIERYGFNVPIIVDTEKVIISGHVRYKALRQLDYEEVPCVVADLSPQKAREFRIADNKTSEISEWDESLLDFELRQIEEIEELTTFFDEGTLDEYITSVPTLEEMKEEETLEKVFDKSKEFAPTGDEIKELKKKDKTIIEKDSKELEEALNKLREERIAEQNKQIQELDEDQQEMFTERVKQKIEDYVEIECPYCDKVYTVSVSEIERLKIRAQKNRG